MKKWCLILLLAMFCNAACAQTDFKIITLQHRLAQDILPVVQPMAGEEGSVSAIDNNLLIRTTPERMGVIEQTIATLDKERKNLRITIRHEDTERREQTHASIAGRVTAGKTQVDVNDPHLPREMREGVVIEADKSSHVFRQQGSEFLTVLDGARAFIRVGHSVPYTQQWLVMTQRYLHLQQTTEFREIATGFAVRPNVIGKQIELEITPRIASLSQAGFIDFEELSTVVIVMPGQWFDLGGTMQKRDEVSQLILSGGTDSGKRKTKLMVKVD